MGIAALNPSYSSRIYVGWVERSDTIIRVIPMSPYPISTLW